MVNKTNDDRLDSFLTTIESKLRGPFSSLDLSKAVSTAALRPPSTTTQFGSSAADNDSNDPARKYLRDLSAVFGRTNKVIQCRMLIGLLGLNDLRTTKKKPTNGGGDDGDDSVQYLTPEILRILRGTQEGPLHEEWVRTTSGLIEGVMFRTKDGSEDGNSRESCRGNEAAKIIRETGTEVCEKVERQIQNVGVPYQGNQHRQQTQSTELDQQAAKTTTNTESKKPNSSTSAAAANKRNRGFVIEKVKASSSPPIAKKKEKPPTRIKQEPSPAVVARTEPTPPDLNACFAPYRYRLIPTPVLNTIIPEFELSKDNSNGTSNGDKGSNGTSNGDYGSRISNSNCHFQVNVAAKILQVDLRLEAQRAREHGSHAATKPKNQGDVRSKSNPTAVSGTGRTTALPPGFRQPKKKRPTSLFNTTTKFRPQQTKTVLRGKRGGAQALMKSGATAGGGGAVLNKLGSAGGGRFGGSGGVKRDPLSRMGGGIGRSSRMKMIDDDDVGDTLTKLQRSNATRNMTAAELRQSKRKRILEEAAQRGIHGSGGGATSSFGNQQLRKKQRALASSASRGRPGMQRMATKTEPKSPQPQEQQGQTPEWQSLLRDRSNKMSSEDKLRVRQFFTTTNAAERSSLLLPSEGGPVYKMKIHEERGKDPATGQEIKETFYLELNYDTGTSSQSKKVKRY